MGAGWATEPGAAQETVTSVAGSLPQVSRSCSGLVVVGSGSVVVGGPLGAVARVARGARRARAAAGQPAAAPTPAAPMMKTRRENRGFRPDFFGM